MAIEIVSFPIKHGGSFHSYVNVYQMVTILTQPTIAAIPSHPHLERCSSAGARRVTKPSIPPWVDPRRWPCESSPEGLPNAAVGFSGDRGGSVDTSRDPW